MNQAVAIPSGVSLRERVFKAGGWTAAGYAASQLLRLGSNLILTRLLFPEAFGLMALMYAIMFGVNMLTDLGLSQSIVRSTRGADPAFVNTAWTLQIGKGVLVALAMWAAGGPAAAHFGQPMMDELMGGVALVALMSSFNSTKIALASRKVEAGRIVMIDLGTQVVGIVATVLLAWWKPSVWALVWGNLIAAGAKVLASHALLHGPANRLAWDSAAARSIFSFGGWIMLSSAVTFLSGEGSRLLAASLLDIRLIGLMVLSSSLNLMAWQAIQQLSSYVLFPAYSEVVRAQDPARLSRVVEKSRLTQIAPAWTLSMLICFLGPWLIEVLYDERYSDAGLILQIQAAGLMISILNGSYTGVLWAMGKVGLSTGLLAMQTAINWGGMLLGMYLLGPLGVIVGGAATGWLMYPVTARVFSRLGLWHPRIDLPVMLASLLVYAAMASTMDWSVGLAW